MTHTDTKTKKRYTLREVQQIASSTYGLLIQSLNANSRAPYGIWFEGQLVAQVKKLSDAIAIFPSLYTAIQEQLAEQQKAIAPTVEEAITQAEEVAPLAVGNTEDCAKSDNAQTLQHPEDNTGKFAHHAYDDLTNWELREQLNERGYKDAMQYREPAHTALPYMAGYNRGVRDRRPLTPA